MINKMNLQLFAETEVSEAMETISGRKLVYLFRVAEDSKTENAGALAFVTENERSTSKDADSTATKDGNVRTPGTAEIEITSTSLLPKGDKMIDKLETAMLEDKLVECWEVNLEEPGTTTNTGKYKSKYYQGYITELSVSSSAEDNVEVSITYGANGTGASGYATLTDEQKEIASYVYKDVTKESK